ncbi:hypothetical protein LSH36_514g01029 [Paralvinella palmiformis]|uniref:Signal recognition particle SRP72 subunit RNA-binding domain-containing protein n=1 Tax=Paralvinella palmiformis TaxID=53620 RepID=A0AAD9J890_9ANNE|nr:hypothetical protein LSH36_514g01029 [Paralvinella palmiformis]
MYLLSYGGFCFRQDPSDLKTLAQLISAYSKFDPQKAQLVSRELPLPTDLSKNIDIDSLELSANTLGPKYTKRTVKMEQSPVAGSPCCTYHFTVCFSVKLPKDYDPNATPDVERWLPLRERSYYRGKGTQGAVSASAAAELDKSIPSGQPTGTDKQPAAASPKSGSSGSTPVVGPRQQKPQTGRQARKKKKGGNKW